MESDFTNRKDYLDRVVLNLKRFKQHIPPFFNPACQNKNLFTDLYLEAATKVTKGEKRALKEAKKSEQKRWKAGIEREDLIDWLTGQIVEEKNKFKGVDRHAVV